MATSNERVNELVNALNDNQPEIDEGTLLGGAWFLFKLVERAQEIDETSVPVRAIIDLAETLAEQAGIIAPEQSTRELH